MNIIKNKIVSIKTVDKTSTSWYVIKKEIKILGIVIRKYGIHSSVFSNTFYEINDKDIMQNKLIENDILYIKPRVNITLCNDKTYQVYFDTYTEAIKYENHILKDLDSFSI